MSEQEIEYGNKDVNTIVRHFSDLYGVTKTTKWDRYSAKRMASSTRYGGAEGIVLLMTMFHSFRTDRYAPVVSSVSQFESKLPAIVTYLERQRGSMEVIQL